MNQNLSQTEIQFSPEQIEHFRTQDFSVRNTTVTGAFPVSPVWGPPMGHSRKRFVSRTGRFSQRAILS